jgi:hypothetical protein
MRATVSRLAERGQVVVMFTVLLVVLLGFAGIAIDIGRQNAEQRHIQTAADAAALAGCRALISGATDLAAASEARSIARINIERSAVDGSPNLAPDGARVYADGHAGDPAYLVSGLIVSNGNVRVAISSSVETTLARVVGVSTLDTSARARCQLQGGPAIPIVARRYTGAPGPGNGFVDFLASQATSTLGKVDTTSVLGYDNGVRQPASETAKGPIFEIYGPGAKASNEANFRGFVALDIRNFESAVHSYYNGVTSSMSTTTLKDKEGVYLITGYPGPAFPPITSPADPNDQVATLLGNDSPMVVGNFKKVFKGGDRVLLAIYNGTLMQVPDFAIAPPSAITLTGASPTTGPNFTVSRNDAFNSTVTLHLHGDATATALGHPEWDLIPTPSVSPPTAGHMTEPIWSTNVFVPAKNGTTVTMNNISWNAIPAGIYTVWLEGHSGNPYFQTRRSPVPVKVGGAVRDFSLTNSTTTTTIPTLGGSASIPIYVSTANSGNAAAWGSTNPVTLGIDSGSLTDCSLNPVAIAPGQLTLSTSTVVPTSSGNGALSTLTISSVGLAPDCYRFNVRAFGTNGAGQPVVHIQPVTFYVVTQGTGGSYVDLIGFAVFELSDLTDPNSITGRAVTRIVADPNDRELFRGERARLRPW